MPLINVTNVIIMDNPTAFLNPFQFQITFECLQELTDGNHPSTFQVPLKTFDFIIHRYRMESCIRWKCGKFRRRSSIGRGYGEAL